DFMPHGHCYLWDPGILWLHVFSDSSIALAYFSIPIALVAFVRKREDLSFNGIFLLFALFIFACGLTHLFGVWTVWNGTYRLEGIVKAITAFASVATAIVLWKALRTLLSIPSRSELEEEVIERRKAEERLLSLHGELEVRVEERARRLQESESRYRSLVLASSA